MPWFIRLAPVLSMDVLSSRVTVGQGRLRGRGRCSGWVSWPNALVTGSGTGWLPGHVMYHGGDSVDLRYWRAVDGLKLRSFYRDARLETIIYQR